MFRRLKCRNGHRWKPEPGVAAPGEEDRCPTCGLAPAHPLHKTAGDWWAFLVVEVLLLAACAWGLDRWGWQVLTGLLGAAAGLKMVALYVIGVGFRSRRMEAVCRKMGFAFAGEVSPRRLKAFGPFDLLTRGKRRSAYYLMTGRWQGRDLALFELQYTTAGGTSPPEHRTVVVVADAPAGEGIAPAADFARHFLPGGPATEAIQAAAAEGRRATLAGVWGVSLGGLEFRLEPVNTVGRLGQWLGLQDVLFPDHSAFSKRYRVSGPSGEAIRRAFRPEVLDFFAEHPGWSVEVLGGRLLAHCPGPAAAAECPGLLTEVVRMHRVLMRAWAASQNV